MSGSCSRCGSNNLKRLTGEDEVTAHYGRLICEDCGRFLKWLRDPTVCVSHLNRKQAIDLILANGNPNQWERQFLNDIRDRRVLTPKQQATYEKIHQKIAPSLGSGRGGNGRPLSFLRD